MTAVPPWTKSEGAKCPVPSRLAFLAYLVLPLFLGDDADVLRRRLLEPKQGRFWLRKVQNIGDLSRATE
jgi:hypothetical protein